MQRDPSKVRIGKSVTSYSGNIRECDSVKESGTVELFFRNFRHGFRKTSKKIHRVYGDKIFLTDVKSVS